MGQAGQARPGRLIKAELASWAWGEGGAALGFKHHCFPFEILNSF